MPCVVTESLAKAREKCKLSELYSDLGSGAEEKKRNRLKTSFNNCCDSEEPNNKCARIEVGLSSDDSDNSSSCGLLLPLPEFKNSSVGLTDLLTVSPKTISGKRERENDQELTAAKKTCWNLENISQRHKKDQDQGLSLLTFFLVFSTVSIVTSQIDLNRFHL